MPGGILAFEAEVWARVLVVVGPIYLDTDIHWFIMLVNYFVLQRSVIDSICLSSYFFLCRPPQGSVIRGVLLNIIQCALAMQPHDQCSTHATIAL